MNHPPTFDLDRLQAGELEDHALLEIQQHVEACAECRSYLDGLQADQISLLSAQNPEAFADRLQDASPVDLRSRPIGNWGFLLGTAAAATAVAVLVVVVLFGLDAKRSKESSDLRWMGQTLAVEVFVKRGEKTSPFTGQSLEAFDQLRFKLSLPEGQRGFATLLALEGERVFALLPKGDDLAPIPVEGETFLPGSVVVEAGELPVDLFLVFRPETYRIADALVELKKAGPRTKCVYRLRIPQVKP